MMAQGGGKIIHLASVSSFQGARQIVGYATGKHGLVGLTKCLANEWAAKGINVNAIAPGLFETDMVAYVTKDPIHAAEQLGRIPAGRFGKPEDLVGPLLFLASGLYHSIQANPRALQRLRKFDHSAIYLLIAGTYTPICFNMLEGFWKWGMLSIVWGLALAGIGVKIFFIKAPRWVTAGVYILMGWLCILGIQEILAALSIGAIIWLASGGIIFTLGAIVYITKTMDFVPGVFGFHEVWHIFVILGALAHFIMIATYIAPIG